MYTSYSADNNSGICVPTAGGAMRRLLNMKVCSNVLYQGGTYRVFVGEYYIFILYGIGVSVSVFEDIKQC